jgi:cytidylate kinase
MYRAVGYKLIRDNVDMYDEDALLAMLEATDIDFSGGKTILDGEDISDRIRTQEISRKASECSALAPVRAKLVELQKKMGSTKSVIMDGRDIGTVVLKDAELKIYLTASAEERAERRYKELLLKGEDISYEKVLADMQERDYNDMHREITPLRKADDAIELDTTGMSIDEVTEYILRKVK